MIGNKKIKSITLCSSVSFYKQGLEIEKRLKAMGFRVWVEHTARVMQRTGNWKVSDYKHWYRDPKRFSEKAKLMMRHFKAIEKGDAILVVNLEKKGLPGYIGGNVLMEMAIAFWLRKPIYLLNPVSKRNPVYEEIMAVGPVILNGEISTSPALRASSPRQGRMGN
jgi:hypothetical protein